MAEAAPTSPTKTFQTRIEYLKNKLSRQYMYYNHSEPRKKNQQQQNKTKQMNNKKKISQSKR